MKQSVMCILDILGTKGIWVEEKVEQYFDVLDEVAKVLVASQEHFDVVTKGMPIKLDYFTFSDTLVIVITNEKKHDYFFAEIIDGFSRMINGIFGIYFSYDFFLRGAISFGDIAINKNRFVGPVVDDAGEYFELQDMIGVCLTPKASLAMEYAIEWNLKYFNKRVDSSVIKYNTPLKNKLSTELFQINWVESFKNPIEGTPNLNPFSYISSTLSKRNIPVNAISKFSNTIDFVKYVLNQPHIM